MRPGRAAGDVFFYVNGTPRLLMSCVIAEELYPHHRKHLILLHQYGYTYHELLPHVRDMFERVYHLHVRADKYTHLDQLLNSYLNPYPGLRRFFHGGAEVVLFGIRSPVQKFIVRYNKALGNTVNVYAESLSVDRYFAPRPDAGLASRLARRVFPRAFAFQHDYDVFYVLNREMYRESPHFPKLATMFDLYGSATMRRYSALLTQSMDLDELRSFDLVFFGQPLSSPRNNFLTLDEEKTLLQRILGGRRVLILPHPGETGDQEEKYRVLPEARFLRTAVPNDILLPALRPPETMTCFSTIGITYAAMNPQSVNRFFPIHRSRYEMLQRYRRFIPNMEICDTFIRSEDPYESPP